MLWQNMCTNMSIDMCLCMHIDMCIDVCMAGPAQGEAGTQQQEDLAASAMPDMEI